MRQRLHRPADGFPDACERAERGWQPRLQVGLDRARQNGGRALGADRDGHGIAVDDGGRDEIAVLQIVDDVDQRALGAGDVGDTGVLGRILGCAVDCYGAARVARFERSAVQGQPPLGRPIHDLGRGSGREDDDLRLGFQEQPELGQTPPRRRQTGRCGGPRQTGRWGNAASSRGPWPVWFLSQYGTLFWKKAIWAA
jgi:hypothetical protein